MLTGVDALVYPAFSMGADGAISALTAAVPGNRLLAALQGAIGTDAVVITDGGDFLSFARIGLSARWPTPAKSSRSLTG